ncbi:uncharacterized protein LOC133309165 [Gastrolobium bilobum]|uniref:uncharacterized protein LOC133309165 n=1 Tax=Gastrolobium bilobum TaxID=150636 RepID=UPI002AB20F45|nr:uncharacterized protein LOC133309165 [Gastrolobium bilobum]
MDSLLSMLFFLLTFFSFNPFSSFASQPSYKDHCASIIPESTPKELTLFNSFPLGYHHKGYFTGGHRIIDVGTSLNQHSFYLQTRYTQATQVSDLFKIEGTLSFTSTTNRFYHHVGNFTYGDSSYNRRRHLTFKLDGFWSESSGKVCMVGKGSGYSKTGDSLNLDVVFKLNNVFNVSNISSLISGTLESLSSEKDGNYFEPISVLMFPKANYTYTLDSIAENEFSSGVDAEGGLPLDFNSLSFCKYPLSMGIRRLQLEYSHECNSSKNCTPISGSSDQLPSLVSLKGIECSHTKKHRLRVLMRFSNTSYSEMNQGFNPKTMLIGEGWWDEKKNRFCVVACHIMGMASSLAGTQVGECSVRLRLRFPSIWSIKDTSKIEGQIWSNKTTNDTGYFKMITFRNDEDHGVGIQGLKYEYSQLERVKKSCATHKPVKNQKRRYPDAYSNNMRFDMVVSELNNKRPAFGYSDPLSVGDQVYESGLRAENTILVHNNNDSLFNISYKITVLLNSTIGDRQHSLFNLSYERVKISAEGIYDAGTGTLCMVGCRDLSSNTGTPIAHSVDCEIIVKFQFPSLDNASIIEGSIESTRKISDPLYFKRLDLSSTAFYTEVEAKTVWRMDMEVIMVLISNTLACAFVGLQLYHVKRHPNVLPFISLTMMSILTVGFMIPLVLNFEALLTQNPNNKNFVFGNVGWLEVNEISVRLITMVAFLLQFRLLQLTWSSRKTDESKKGLWVAERKVVYVTLSLYAAGLLIALLLKKDGNKDPTISSVYQQHHSSWENFKSYGGLVLDGFLLPQIMLNLFSNMKENVLSCSFYFGTTFVRLLPHAYDLYRTHNYAFLDNGDGSYFYADPSADFYSTAWDIVIPLGGILFAIIIYLQQRFGADFILPHRLKGSKVYQKVPVVTESEAEVEATNM